MMRNSTVRWVLLPLFAFLTLPCLTLLAASASGMRALFALDMALRAAPLVGAVTADRVFLDGGELSPQLMPLWVVLTGVLLWPLLVLGIHPGLWKVPRWRRGILAYDSCAVAMSIACGWWVFTHTGHFF